MFAVFARLTRAEAIPAAERIEGGPWRLLPKARGHRRERRRPRAAVPGKLPGPMRRPFLFNILISFPQSGQAPKFGSHEVEPFRPGWLRISRRVGDRSDAADGEKLRGS